MAGWILGDTAGDGMTAGIILTHTILGAGDGTIRGTIHGTMDIIVLITTTTGMTEDGTDVTTTAMLRADTTPAGAVSTKEAECTWAALQV